MTRTLTRPPRDSRPIRRMTNHREHTCFFQQLPGNANYECGCGQPMWAADVAAALNEGGERR